VHSRVANESKEKQGLPLAGVKVLELSHIVAGPSAGVILADLGADVIKIENPVSGDQSRNQANEGASFFTFNRNKRYLALDLQQQEGKRIFESLVKKADVVLDNFSPGALDRMGIGYSWGQAVNPKIIYCSVKGFLPGPNSDRPFLDELAQMAGGLAYLTGYEDRPIRAGASITDIGAATYGVLGILAALYRRQATGRGDKIESGLFETVVFWIAQHITRAQMTGINPPPRGEQSSGMGAAMGWGVYQLFQTKEAKPLFIAVTSNGHWQSLCGILGMHDWTQAAEFDTNGKRSTHKQRIAERIGSEVKNRWFDELAKQLLEAGIPFSPVNRPLDLVDDNHLREADRWMHLKITGHDLKLPKLPFDMAETEEFALSKPPAGLGEQSREVLLEAGFTQKEISDFEKSGIVRTSQELLSLDKRRPG
jgi:crotonobetainyl-CoA:carnitine CoA-transferase CaiB-like acyl-CoA transferase